MGGLCCQNYDIDNEVTIQLKGGYLANFNPNVEMREVQRKAMKTFMKPTKILLLNKKKKTTPENANAVVIKKEAVDELSEFDLDDSYKIPAELLNALEENMKLGKKHMYLIIEYFLSGNEGYKELLNTPEVTSQIKEGTELSEDVRIMKGCMIIEGKYSLRELVHLMTNNSNRAEWDSSLRDSKILKRYSKHLTTSRYAVKVPMMFMDDREFIDKTIAFRYNNSIYIYSSFISDSFSPLRSGFTRGYNIFTGTKVSRHGRSIHIEIITQMDVKVSMPTAFVGGKMADSLVQYRKDLLAKLGS